MALDEARERARALDQDAQEEQRPSQYRLGRGGSGLSLLGWIDGIRKSFDEKSFLQRFTPRRPKSIWSQVNRDHVTQLIADGRMTPHGLAHVEAAKLDGRWQNAYAPQRSTTLPDDLAAAIAASKKATATLEKLDRVNRFALAFRVSNMKTAAGRQKKIEQFVALLKKGEGPLGKPAGKAKAPKSSG